LATALFTTPTWDSFFGKFLVLFIGVYGAIVGIAYAGASASVLATMAKDKFKAKQTKQLKANEAPAKALEPKPASLFDQG
jgi:hypothetical protein